MILITVAFVAGRTIVSEPLKGGIGHFSVQRRRAQGKVQRIRSPLGLGQSDHEINRVLLLAGGAQQFLE